MPFRSHAPRRWATVALSFACAALVSACGNTASSNTITSSPTSAGSTSATPSAPVVPSAQVPTSCSAIPASLIGHYTGGVATTKSLGSPPNGVSCEFANSTASKIVIVNIGQGGTAANFAALRAKSGQEGRTTTPISGLASSAFSISNGGKRGGVNVLTAQGLIFSVAANLPFAQDEALIQQLMKLF